MQLRAPVCSRMGFLITKSCRSFGYVTWIMYPKPSVLLVAWSGRVWGLDYDDTALIQSRTPVLVAREATDALNAFGDVLKFFFASYKPP